MSKHAATARATRHVVMISLGWVLLVAGLAALVLPGPGMLMTFAGMAILARYHGWARRWLRPVKLKALQGAAEGVETRVRILASALGGLAIAAFGVLWLWRPSAPGWWPLREDWWLVGGRPVGITLAVSGVLALVLLVFSVRRYHHQPEAVAELQRKIRARKQAVAKVRARRRHR